MQFLVEADKKRLHINSTIIKRIIPTYSNRPSPGPPHGKGDNTVKCTLQLGLSSHPIPRADVNCITKYVYKYYLCNTM